MNASVKDTEIKKFLIKTWITVDTSFSCRDINPGVRGVCDNAALSADIIDPFINVINFTKILRLLHKWYWGIDLGIADKIKLEGWNDTGSKKRKCMILHLL